MSGDAKRNFIERMTWDEVACRVEKGAVAILPIGAAAKEHGFHLPMNTDQVQAEWLAAEIADRIDALIWPTVTYGCYPAFVDYPGSCSLDEQTFEALVREIVTGISGSRCRAVFVLNTGISTLAAVDRALARLDNRHLLHLKIYDGARYRRAAERLAEQSHGSHADELETSRMLVLAPHLVNMNRAEASPAIAGEAAGRLTRSDASSPNFSRSGSFGDPTLATSVKGEILLAAMIDDLLELTTSFLTKAIAANSASSLASTQPRSASR